MVRLKNGILAAPHKGPAPMAPPNYTTDPNDPYVFYPTIPKCDRRLCIMVKDKKCNCDKPAYFCGKDKRVNPYPDCHTCTRDDKITPPVVEPPVVEPPVVEDQPYLPLFDGDIG